MKPPTSMVAVDLALHPDVSWCVIHNGQLLPIRFRTEEEATGHLHDVSTNTYLDRSGSLALRRPNEPGNVARHTE